VNAIVMIAMVYNNQSSAAIQAAITQRAVLAAALGSKVAQSEGHVQWLRSTGRCGTDNNCAIPARDAMKCMA
jgi:hypothetical protein